MNQVLANAICLAVIPARNVTSGKPFAADKYFLTVPGPNALAIHVIDGLGSSESAAEVGSLNDTNYDPSQSQNSGVIGAAVYRNSLKQSYVVASSAPRGASGASMTYGVPGASAARHVVYDAPEAGDGTSLVVAAVATDRCVVTITAGSGGGVPPDIRSCFRSTRLPMAARSRNRRALLLPHHRRAVALFLREDRAAVAPPVVLSDRHQEAALRAVMRRVERLGVRPVPPPMRPRCPSRSACAARLDLTIPSFLLIFCPFLVRVVRRKLRLAL